MKRDFRQIADAYVFDRSYTLLVYGHLANRSLAFAGSETGMQIYVALSAYSTEGTSAESRYLTCAMFRTILDVLHQFTLNLVRHLLNLGFQVQKFWIFENTLDA